MSPEPLDEVTHRTSRGGNCEPWGYKAIEGSDERTRKTNPPHPPQQDRHPGIQQKADFVKTLRGIPSPGWVAAQPPTQRTTLPFADPSPSLRSSPWPPPHSSILRCWTKQLQSCALAQVCVWHEFSWEPRHEVRGCTPITRNLATPTFLSSVGKSG